MFNKLFVLANMPIQRFGTMLINKGEFDGYLQLLQDAHLDANLDGVMCRNLISVDWRGFVYDCDFNQMLDLPLTRGQAHAPASVRSHRRRPRGQPDPRRRPLLWLHRRTRLELRRRAERGGGMSASPLAFQTDGPGQSGRPRLPFRLPLFAQRVFARAPDFAAETLYVVGGLYGNLAALAALDNLAAMERTPATSVFNGDFHWFDADPDWFAAHRARRRAASALRGNVETEIARVADIGAGCGCAYPESVPTDVVRARTRSCPCCRQRRRRRRAGS